MVDGTSARDVLDLGAGTGKLTRTLVAAADYADALIAGVGYYRSHRNTLAAVLELAAYDEAVQTSWDAQLATFDETVRGLIRAEQEAGRTPTDVDVELAGRVVVWGGIELIAWHVLNGDPGRDAHLARELATLQWYGVFRRPEQ